MTLAHLQGHPPLLAVLADTDRVAAVAAAGRTGRLMAVVAEAAASTAILVDADVMITYDDRLAVAARHNGVMASAPGSKALRDQGLGLTGCAFDTS